MSYNEVPLKDLLGGKGYIRGPFGSALKRNELKKEGIPVYEQQHAIRGDRNFRYYIDKDKYENLKRFTVETNDLIISCSGTVGRISVIREEDPKGIISQALLILRPDAVKILPEYLFYFFTSKQGFSELINASQGAVQLNIAPRAVVEKIPVPTPSIDEQKEIINKLKTLDDKIELNRQTNQTLEHIAQAIFKSWFVDFEPTRAKIAARQAYHNLAPAEKSGVSEQHYIERAAICAISGKTPEQLDQLTPENQQQLKTTAALFPDALVESELGEVPEGWVVKKVEDVIKRYSVGKKFSQKTTFEAGAVPVLDQGRSGIIGFHNEKPGVKASTDDPIIVFANHTCYMRLIMHDFSAIQNVLPFKGADLNIFWIYLATYGKQEFVEYKGHWPDFVIREIVVPSNSMDKIFGDYVVSIWLFNAYVR